MAYFNQDQKKVMAPKIKAICAKYGVKGRLAIQNHSTVVLNIPAGKLDFIGNANANCQKGVDRQDHVYKGSIDVNVYYVDSHFDGDCQAFLNEILVVLNEGNHDRSDIQSDYFDVGWYVSIQVGKWNKPYQMI